MNYDLKERRRTSTDSERSERTDKSDRSEKTGSTIRDRIAQVVTGTPRKPTVDSPRIAVKPTPEPTPRKSIEGAREPTKEKERVVVPEEEAPPAERARMLSRDEIREKLIGYMPIPRKHWEDLCRGDHVRWVDNKDEFSKGGFVKFFFDKEGKRHLQVESILGGNRSDKFYSTYTVALDELKCLYKKIGVDYHILRAQFAAEFTKMKSEIRAMKSGGAATPVKK